MASLVQGGPTGDGALEGAAVAELCQAGGGEQADPGAVDHWFEHRNTVPTWTELFEQGLVADTIEVATGWRHLAHLYTAVIEAINAVPTVIAATAHTSHAYQSGANLYFTFVAQPSDPGEYQSVHDACWAAAMQAATDCGAGIAHHHGIGRVRRPWMTDELGDAGVKVLRSVKAAPDPDTLINPGALIPDGPQSLPPSHSEPHQQETLTPESHATWTASVSLSGTSAGNDNTRCLSSAVATRASVSIRFFAPPPSSSREMTD